MSTTITVKLNNAARQFQAGESTGFGIRAGVKYYDRETKQNEWTNYECVIFARNPNQVAFYQQSLVEGAVIEITAKNQKIKQFQGQNGLSLSIELLDASFGLIHTDGNAQAPQQRQQAPAQPYGQPQQAPASGGFTGQPQQFSQHQAPQQRQQAPAQPAPGAFDDFDQDVPF